jgi:cobalamin biosynthetic protein CobC
LLEHGGKLDAFSKEYGIPLNDWLDLSTGINPIGYPVGKIPPEAFRRLPNDSDLLDVLAAEYYHSQRALPVAGSQAAIQAIPRLREHSKVAVLTPSYNEHIHSWQSNGHSVIAMNSSEIDSQIEQFDVVVVCNPNNPTGEIFSPITLLSWLSKLQASGGWLIVDEAFADVNEDYSISSEATAEGLIVLRSLGKFFGLAGVRVGFVLTWEELHLRLKSISGPWCISGPSRHIAQVALQDCSWQKEAKEKLRNSTERLKNMLIAVGLSPAGVPHPQALNIHSLLCKQGILTRFFREPLSLRFGLPGSAADWARLEIALTRVELELRTSIDACRQL